MTGEPEGASDLDTTSDPHAAPVADAFTVTFVSLLTVAALPALGQETPTCFGLEPTIVGNERSNRLMGTWAMT